jgi:hypothetical protein
MSDPRGEYGFLDFFVRNGMEKNLFADDAEALSAAGAETTLKTYAIPATALRNVGDFIRGKIKGRFAASGNARRIRVLFGAALVPIDSISSASWDTMKFEIDFCIRMSAVGAQLADGKILGILATAAGAAVGTAIDKVAGTEDETIANNLAIKTTGVAGSDVAIESVRIDLCGAGNIQV